MVQPKIFVSHSHDDDAFATRLVADLRAAGANAWLDKDDLGAGDFQERISAALGDCEWLVLVLTRNALASKWVRQEVNAANGLQHRGQIRDLIFIKAGPVEHRELPALWSVYNIFDATADYATACNHTLKSVGLSPVEPHVSVSTRQQDTPRVGDAESAPIRRWPVYLLLDCSASMAGTPIETVTIAVQQLYDDLNNDPVARTTVWISIITFGSRTTQYPLTPLSQFRPPLLVAAGETPIGAALRLLAESIERDLVDGGNSQQGDYKPLVFLITDGEATDSTSEQIARLKALRGNRHPNIVALALGLDANPAKLRQLTDNVLSLTDGSAEKLREFFRFIT
jgi:uncharacterized protein YegL